MTRLWTLQRNVRNGRMEILIQLVSRLDISNHGNLRQNVKTAPGPKTNAELIKSELLNWLKQSRPERVCEECVCVRV